LCEQRNYLRRQDFGFDLPNSVLAKKIDQSPTQKVIGH
jgi:hypothetical protein